MVIVAESVTGSPAGAARSGDGFITYCITPEERTLTAHHEAGHAVVAYALDVQIRSVSIASGTEHLGRVVLERWPEQLEREGVDDASTAYLRKAIMVTLAGPAAERRVARERYASLPRLEEDRHMAADWVLRLSADPK